MGGQPYPGLGNVPRKRGIASRTGGKGRALHNLQATLPRREGPLLPKGRLVALRFA